MTTPFFSPPEPDKNLKTVAILFSGGPAPAANAVITGAAGSFSRFGIKVLGILNGYTHLMEYKPGQELKKGAHYMELDHVGVEGHRSYPGIVIGTARANPGKGIKTPKDLDDKEKTAPLQTVYDALSSLEVDALISIGGDDTLTTAAKFKLYQERLPAGKKRIRVIHLPKTIDNDYHGIDFTFGYFTAVDMMAHQIRNLTADAKANNAYFFVQAMGRKAGWLAYGAAIAGEASLVISLEDLPKDWWSTEDAIDPKTGQKIVKDGKPLQREVFDVYKVADWVLSVMLAREKHGKQFGVVVVAEGMAEFLPVEELKKCITDDEFRTLEPDPHGHYPVSQVPFSRRLGAIVAEKYAALPKDKKLVSKRKIVGLVSGYEVRCNPPTAFDVMLGSQLGVGAYRALAEEKLDGVMVSLHGQLALSYVPFIDREKPEGSLINPDTLRAQVRLIKTGEDFHLLARYLETRLEG